MNTPPKLWLNHIINKIQYPLLTGLVCTLLTACNPTSTQDLATATGTSSDPVTPVDPTPTEEPTPEPLTAQQACDKLNDFTLPASSLILPTGEVHVVSATLILTDTIGNTLGEYCQVRGKIFSATGSAPEINFAVNLPTHWNNKAIHFGGGGFNGRLIDGTETVRFSLPSNPAPLAQGYATWGDDSGHQSGSITDGSFAMDDEALANYGGDTLKKTHDVALLLLKQRYNTLPQYSYFLGTSTGGRDALAYIQRWPLDYDGVIANEPALNYSATRLSNVAVGRALYLDGGAGWLNINKTLLVQQAAMAACDRLDGATDNVISNVEGCRAGGAQVLANLRCPGGIDSGDTCLSDAQIATVKVIESPLQLNYALANGVTVAGGYNLLEGTLVAGSFTTRNLGTRSTPGNPAVKADANMYVTGDQWVKYFITRDASFNALTFNPADPDSYTSRVQQVSALTDATNPDISEFLGHRHRLILLHGLADEVISPNSTIAWYQAVINQVGQEATHQGIRFYTVPGMGHGTGSFLPAWNSLAALENWVEHGVAPGNRWVMDINAKTFGRTRPLCQYPSWPKYHGSGSLDAAINYSCTDSTNILPQACSNLPTTATTYKGGNTFGEELTINFDPTTMNYSITIDASLQRPAGTLRSGTLIVQNGCTFSSDENGALFTFTGGGVLSGGVAKVSESEFLPLVAFQNVSDDYKAIADIYNVTGIQYSLSNDNGIPLSGSARLRSSAATWQTCRDPNTQGFIIYDANCSLSAKGYIAWNNDRNAFDYFIGGTPANKDGKLSGSIISGMVNGKPVPLVLTRSDYYYGMEFYAPQPSALPLATGAADGNYHVMTTEVDQFDIELSGSTVFQGNTYGELTYNQPVLGVINTAGTIIGSYTTNGGILSLITDDSFGLGLLY
ncbi:tannase/feruloyl esterase family alpha/beta hydrolase [Serratia sp. UGAL515B_01]|uniref:tannase/feruloyl esterase family alpha/beta hydrolase n=1 Tax=Serratia sp. UGAL515B_01 TaxID=2986763 RepID=UPI0029553AB4|nr:tannase/feruloyl esterase family alpha/beta hydrolase [Serratia sp. UGAL515B_01]WON78717.1 tannase/feruloyl esterase family alpha/beta hydrolase [Serratia sp. UGAL515B_01]